MLPGRLNTTCGEARLCHLIDLKDFVAVVVDNLQSDLACRWLWERTAVRAVEHCPGVLVDVRPKRSLQLVVGIVTPDEVRMANEEALAVVVRVDEPASNVFCRMASNDSGGWVVDIEATDLDGYRTI